MYAVMANVQQVFVTNVEKTSEGFYIMDRKQKLWVNVRNYVFIMLVAILSTGHLFTKEDGVVPIPTQITQRNRLEILFFALKISFVAKIRIVRISLI